MSYRYEPTDLQVAHIKEILREDDIPFYEEEQISFYFDLNGGNMNKTLYQMLIRKSENTSLNVSGMAMADESAYFKRLAASYRPNNSGILKGG